MVLAHLSTYLDYNVGISSAVAASFFLSALHSIVIGVIVGLLINLIKAGTKYVWEKIKCPRP